MSRISVILFPFVLLLLSCDRSQDIPETATSGKVRIAYDEGLRFIARQESDVFQYLYKYTIVKDTIAPQEIAHQLFLKDSVELIFTTRMLNENEKAFFQSKNIIPRTYEFARDGLTVLVNKSGKDSLFTLDQLKSIIKGGSQDHFIVAENSKGASLVSLVQLLGIKNDSLKGIFSADSVQGVINYVSENPKAIGLISGNWISDSDSPKVEKLRNKVNIASISSDGKAFFKPYQSEIADSLYPLIRSIFIISRESNMGTASGFSSFLLGDKGQRIVLKEGLLPSRMPSREVVLSKKDVR